MAHPTTHIEQLAKLAASGETFVAVTLIETVGSAPQDSGNKMLVTEHGLAHGTVGGGKIEMRAIEKAQQMLTPQSSETNELVQWNLQTDVGMTCGGVVKLYFETYNRDDWQIVVFGAGHVAQSLTRCLIQLDCRVTCIDSRQDWLSKLPESDRLKAVCCDDLTPRVDQITSDDFVVCMTMGHATDLPILEAIARRGIRPAYVGVIGSKAKRAVLLRQLAEKGISDDAFGKLHCPIGLRLGTNQPAEIAISVTAELIQVRDALRQIRRDHQ